MSWFKVSINLITVRFIYLIWFIQDLEDQTVQNSIRSLLFASRSNEEPNSSTRQQSSKEIDIPGSTCRSQSNEDTSYNGQVATIATRTTNENNLSLGESGFGDYDEAVSSSCSPSSPKLDNRTSIKHTNLMHQRIMQLPLSLQVKQFLLYERGESSN